MVWRRIEGRVACITVSSCRCFTLMKLLRSFVRRLCNLFASAAEMHMRLAGVANCRNWNCRVGLRVIAVFWLQDVSNKLEWSIQHKEYSITAQKKHTVFFLDGLCFSRLAFASRAFAALQSNFCVGGTSGWVESAALSSIFSATSVARFFLDFWSSSHAVFKPEATELPVYRSTSDQIRKLVTHSSVVMVPPVAFLPLILSLFFATSSRSLGHTFVFVVFVFF